MLLFHIGATALLFLIFGPIVAAIFPNAGLLSYVVLFIYIVALFWDNGRNQEIAYRRE